MAESNLHLHVYDLLSFYLITLIFMYVNQTLNFELEYWSLDTNNCFGSGCILYVFVNAPCIQYTKKIVMACYKREDL